MLFTIESWPKVRGQLTSKCDVFCMGSFMLL